MIQDSASTGRVHPLVRCVCGGELFWRAFKPRGKFVQLLESRPDGGVTVVETDLDNMRNGPQPKYMRCTDCGKRVPNPDYSPRPYG